MKKNILAIIILAATIVNITLSAIMLFTVVPKAQRTDELIKKIVAVLNLELENPDASVQELADMHQKAVSKSGVYHRLQKIVTLAQKNQKE